MEHWFSECYLFHEFLIKYFKDIEKLYENFFEISKYYSISNGKVNIVAIDMNNIESSTDSDSSSEVYYINNNSNRILLIIVIVLLEKIRIILLVIMKITVSLLIM